MKNLVLNLLRAPVWPVLAIRRARAAPEGAFVSVELEGPVADLEEPAGPRRWLVSRARGKSPSVRRLRELFRTIVEDRRVSGVFLKIRGFGAGEAVLASVRDAVSELRAGGKDVVAYLPDGADNRALFLASAARFVIAGPETTIAPVGYAAVGRYVRRALERAGVEPEVFARGTYKSAGEALVRDDMSAAEREQIGAILESRYQGLAAALAQGRAVSRETAEGWIQNAPHRANDAVTLGLIDAVAYEDELSSLVATGPRSGPSVKVGKAFELVPFEKYLRARLGARFLPVGSKDVIGVVEVHGPIVSRARFELAPLAAEDKIVASLRAARADDRVRAVVLHIDSPGGSAVASDRIYHEVTRVAETKPVVAYMSNVAASGGYYVAAGAHAIIAQPQTITGSIGVVAARFVVAPLLERLGVSIDVEKRGAHADMFSPARKLEVDERAVMDRELDAFYETFLGVVAKGRKRDVDAIRPLAEGRVYAGTDAQARGLVDLLGGFDRALHEARTLVGKSGRDLEPRIVRAKRPHPPPKLLASAPGPAVLVEAVAHALAALGLDRAAEEAALALNLEGERTLLYWPALV